MYSFHKFNDTPRKYSKQIYDHLKKQSDFVELDANQLIYYWSDKNRKSILQDYYPFNEISIIDKKYLYKLLPSISIPTFVEGNVTEFNKFINNNKSKIYYLKPSDKYIGGGKDIIISNNPYELFRRKKKNDIIQNEIIPSLINGYKYDIRIYSLIVYNKNIVYVYIYPGLIRYCKEKYVNGSIDKNKQITTTGDFELLNESCIHNFKIQHILYLTHLDLKPQNNKIGYQYLGFDIIRDRKDNYHLIEVNIQPCLERINYKIIEDFSRLVARPIITEKGYEPFIAISNFIILSEININHLIDLHAMTSNQEIMKFVGNSKIWSLDKTKRFIEYGNDEIYFNKAIIYEKKIIGIIGKKNDKLMIFLNPLYENKGLAKASLQLFVKIIEPPLYADVLKQNNKSNNFFKNYPKETLINIYRYKIM